MRGARLREAADGERQDDPGGGRGHHPRAAAGRLGRRPGRGPARHLGGRGPVPRRLGARQPARPRDLLQPLARPVLPGLRWSRRWCWPGSSPATSAAASTRPWCRPATASGWSGWRCSWPAGSPTAPGTPCSGSRSGVAALLSPSHLLLLGGGLLMVTSPLRSAWSSPDLPARSPALVPAARPVGDRPDHRRGAVLLPVPVGVRQPGPVHGRGRGPGRACSPPSSGWPACWSPT